MAAAKITDLTALTTIATGDLFVTVDISDTTMGVDGTNKKITWGSLMGAPGAIGGTTPDVGTFTSLSVASVGDAIISLSSFGAKSGIKNNDNGYFLYYDTTTGDTVLDVVFGGASVGINVEGTRKLTIGSGGMTSSTDLTFSDVSEGPVVKSPDGNRWRLQVDNAGVITAVDLDP